MITIKQVPPAELHDWWDEVKEDVEYCRVHDKEQTWAEDVYCAIRTGTAFLYVGTNAQYYHGMMVVTQHQDQWQPKHRWLHVWYCHARNGNPQLIESALEHLDTLAQTIGAEMITFRTNREGFERWGRRHGFEVGEIELRREVKKHA